MKHLMLLIVLLIPSTALTQDVAVSEETPAERTTTPPPAQVPEGVPIVVWPSVQMTMTTPTGSFPMLIELAINQQQVTRGLMYRDNLPDDYGMLFIFPDEAPRNFWMRNTLTDLDIIFIRSDNVVDSIQHGQAGNITGLPSDGPAKFVLEVRHGLADTYGIVPGAEITFK